jgi:hypothetical protein
MLKILPLINLKTEKTEEQIILLMYHLNAQNLIFLSPPLFNCR